MHRFASAGVAMVVAASTFVAVSGAPALPPPQRATTPASAPPAQRGSAPAVPATPARRISTAATCGSDLGTGVKTHRRFCDVVISRDPAAGVAITIPAHRGAATLKFNLHNRFTIPAADVPPAQAFVKHMAVVAVIRATGGVVGRGAVVNEFRSPADLFDQIAGGGGAGSGPKAVAPGQAEHIEIAIPTGVSAVSIVGVSLEATSRAGRDVFDAPGRPVAIVSGWVVEYTPAVPEPGPAARLRSQ